MKTTALFATGIDCVELVDATVPDPGPGEVVVEAIYTAISPGTEMRCLAGRQHGGAFPFILGYSMVGRVAARGAGVTIPERTKVFCLGTERADRPLLWGAHIGHALLSAASVFPLPDRAALLDAALAKVAAIAYRGVRLAKTQPHEEVAVVGLGLIGQLSARLHRLAGARVVAADLDASRVSISEAAGIEALVAKQGLLDTFRNVQPRGADVVVDSTGAGPVLQQAVCLAKGKPWDDTMTEPARLVIQGSYAGDVVFDYHEAFCRELTVLLPRDNQPRDIEAVLRLIADGRLRTRDLITEVRRPHEAPGVYARLRAAQRGLITAVFEWSKP